MTMLNLRRFTKYETLTAIRPVHLLRLLEPYRNYITAHNVPLPEEAADQAQFPYEGITRLLTTDDEAMPQDLLKAFYAIHEMASPAGHETILKALDREPHDLEAVEDTTALDLALQLWLKNQHLFEQLHSGQQSRQRFSSTEGKITIERRQVDDGIHWIVGGVDKGILYSQPTYKRAMILDILYERIGLGWVPHVFFIKHLAWTDEDYFGASGKTGRMQKQLNHLRRHLGVKITFRKAHGVRFDDEVIQAH